MPRSLDGAPFNAVIVEWTLAGLKPQMESYADSMETSNDLVEQTESSKGWWELLRSSADVDAFPAEQSRIDGPRTWTDERQGGADRREENACQRILGVSESEPHSDRGYERAGNGRPQTGEQEETRDDRQHGGGHCGRRPAAQRGNGPRHERGSADEPHDEETHTRPAGSEGRKEPAHNTPTRE